MVSVFFHLTTTRSWFFSAERRSAVPEIFGSLQQLWKPDFDMFAWTNAFLPRNLRVISANFQVSTNSLLQFLHPFCVTFPSLVLSHLTSWSASCGISIPLVSSFFRLVGLWLIPQEYSRKISFYIIGSVLAMMVQFQLIPSRRLGIPNDTLWLCRNSYWTWLFIVDLPIKKGDLR